MIAVGLVIHVTPKTGAKPLLRTLIMASPVLAPSTTALFVKNTAIWIGAMTSKLVASIPSFAPGPLRPANILCIVLTRTWPRGAETRNPNKPILKAFAFTFVATKRCSSGPAEEWTLRVGTPARCRARTSWRKPKTPAEMRMYERGFSL